MWEAPVSCPGADRVLAEAQSLLGEPPQFLTRRGVRGVIEARGSDWQLVLTLSDGARRQSRVLVAPTCDELAHAAGLAIALAFGAAGAPPPTAARLAAGGEYRSEGGAASTAVTETQGVSTPTETGGDGLPAKPPERREDAASARLEAGAVLDGAALPDAALGAAVAVGVTWRVISGFGYATFLPTQTHALSPSASAEFSLIAGGLRGCYEPLRAPLRLGVCAGAELGRLEARGTGLIDAASYGDGWLAAIAGGSVDVPLGGTWYVHGAVDAVIPTVRGSYRVGADRLVFRPPTLGARGALAVGFDFGGE